MILQYSEGMPYLRMNEKDQVAWIMRDYSDELERFYESCTETSRIAISEDFAAGFHAFIEMIKGKRFPILKGHITGPITFTLGLKDNQGRYVYFDEELREIVSMLLQAKARWQIDMLKHHAEKVIIFIDEPILSALGSSSYLGVSTDDVSRLISTLVAAIENAGGIAGIHCCGRADWSMVIDSGPEILNFDAYDYLDPLIIYHGAINQLLQRGGYLAWGIVPTSDSVNSLDEGQIINLLKESLEKMYRHIPAELVNSRILLTPSCGTGLRSIEETVKIFQLLMRVREAMV